MPSPKTRKYSTPLVIRGRNATGKIIEGIIPAGELPAEDPGLAIQKILANHKGITPTPIVSE
jgi:hypothetical protein